MSHNIEGLLRYCQIRQKTIIVLTGVIFLIGLGINLLSTSQKPRGELSSNYQQPVSPTPIPSVTPTPIPNNDHTLIFTGDVIPARSVNSVMVRQNNFKYPFEKTADFLKNADLTIINLESPLIDNCPTTDTGMSFCGDKRFVEGLTLAGVDIVGLANNHIYNRGQDGLTQTEELLKQNNIDMVGTGQILYKEIKGIKFSFLAYNGVTPFDQAIMSIDKNRIKNDLENTKKESDFCVVLFHWGKEYVVNPSTDGQVAPFDPIEIGRFTIDSGADLVVGNHPHVVQGYEIYKGKPIFYALGNFIFDQMWSEETKLGYVLKVNLINQAVSSFTPVPDPAISSGDGTGLQLQDLRRSSQVVIESFNFHPVKIENYSQPSFLEGEEKEKILSKIVPI